MNYKNHPSLKARPFMEAPQPAQHSFENYGTQHGETQVTPMKPEMLRSNQEHSAAQNQESVKVISNKKPKKVRPPSADYNGRNRVLKRNTQSDMNTVSKTSYTNAQQHLQAESYATVVNQKNLQQIDQHSESYGDHTQKTEPNHRQDSKLRVESVEQNNGIYIDSQESFVPGVDSAEENNQNVPPHQNFQEFIHPQVVETEEECINFQRMPQPQIQVMTPTENLTQPQTPFNFLDTLDNPMFKNKDYNKITTQMADDYKQRKNMSLQTHHDAFQRFQQKEQQLIRCFKIKNENTHVASQKDSRKTKSMKRRAQDSSTVRLLKQQHQEAQRTIDADKQHSQNMSTIMSTIQQSQWTNYNTINVVKETTTMANYFKTEAPRVTDQLRAKHRSSQSPVAAAQDTIQVGSSPFRRADSTISKQDGVSIHATHTQLRKEMISQTKAFDAVIQLDGVKRNAPNIKLTNPRSEARKLTRTEIIQMRRMRNVNKKKDWQSFMGYISNNPEALMSIVATPVEPQQILQSLNPQQAEEVEAKMDRYRQKSEKHRNSMSTKSQNNRSEMTRIHSAISGSQNTRKRGSLPNRRPLTGVQRSQNAQNALPQSTFATNKVQSKIRPLTGNPQQKRTKDPECIRDSELFSQNSKSKVETVLKMLNRNTTTPSYAEAPHIQQSVTPITLDKIDLEQIVEDPTPNTTQNNEAGLRRLRPKGRTLSSAMPMRRTQPPRIAEQHRQSVNTSMPKQSRPLPTYEIQDISHNSRQEIWDRQLSIKKLQEQTNQPLSNYEMTNRRLREQAKQLKEQKALDFLCNFNLSQTLVKELSIQRDVKYFKDSTLLALTGISPQETTDDMLVIEEEDSNQHGCKQTIQKIDWRQTQLWRNLRDSEQFNHRQDQRYLSEDQISYCINLLRYCKQEFQQNEQLRQMFDLVIATTQCIYLEMGMSRLFDRLSTKLDEQSVIDSDTCEKLLIRCQLMLSLRGELVRILSQIATCETLIYQFTNGPLDGQDPDQIQLTAEQKVDEIDLQCGQIYDLIREVCEERALIIGKVFFYEGLDLAAPQNLKVKMTSLLLQGLNQANIDQQLDDQVQIYRRTASRQSNSPARRLSQNSLRHSKNHALYSDDRSADEHGTMELRCSSNASPDALFTMARQPVEQSQSIFDHTR